MDNLSAKISEEVVWSTTEMTLTSEEEDTIVTLAVIIGILAAIIFLFFMGLFIDCRTQNKGNGTSKRKRLHLKMPPLGRAQRQQRTAKRCEDSKCLAADMCPNASTEYASTSCIDIVV